MDFKSSVLLMLIFFLGISGRQVIPSRFYFYNADARSVNGSSATGHCSNVTRSHYFTNCSSPNTSVLFDGNIPTLTGLDGGMWASQLLTLQATEFSNTGSVGISFSFADTMNYEGLTRAEMVMFSDQCMPPNYVHTLGQFVRPTINSCNHNSFLIRICLELPTNDTWFLFLINVGQNNWVHLAEVIFYDDSNSTCPPPPPDTTASPSSDTTTPPPSDTTAPPPSDTTAPPPSDTTAPPLDVTITTMLNPTTGSCHVWGTPTVMTVAITAITTALLATVIFVLVQIAICKCHPKFKPGHGETRSSAEGSEELSKKVLENEGKVGTCNPTYTMVEPGSIIDQFQEE